MACSLGSAALRVGEGVISGVRVSMILVGGGGAGLCAYTLYSQLQYSLCSYTDEKQAGDMTNYGSRRSWHETRK